MSASPLTGVCKAHAKKGVPGVNFTLAPPLNITIKAHTSGYSAAW